MAIEIELKNYRAFEDSRPAKWKLGDGFTALVGANNSGKSSLLRFFHEARPALQSCGTFQTLWNALSVGMQPPGDFSSVADRNEVFCNRNDRDMCASFRLAEPALRDPTAFHLKWGRKSRALTLELEVEGVRVQVEANSLDDQTCEVFDASGYRRRVDLSRFVDEFAGLANAVYLGPFRNAVNVGGSAEYYDLQIGEQFIATWDQFKTGNDRAANRAALDVERELEAIFGIDRLQINAAPGNKTLQIIADGQPYQLQEHGAGFAQFIVVFAFVATRRPSYILIDEPELNLHPSLQVDFLTSLARYASHGVAFATHSIGLARTLGEDAYSVRRQGDGSRELHRLEATRSYVEFLGELSLSGYSELGFERVLLVEGSTEVPVLQRWLRLYGIEHQVVLLPLGGSGLINGSSAQTLAEIGRITSSISVLIDSEREAEGAELDPGRQAFVEECSRLEFDVHVMERRALENYLTEDAVKKVKGDGYSALGPFDPRNAITPQPWSKSENWRIAAEMTRAELDACDIGPFLKGLGEA